MDQISFDIKAFVESLDLTVGHFKLLRVEPTQEPTVVVAMSEVVMPPELSAKMGGSDMSMPMWVLWMPKVGILRLHTNLDLGEDLLDEKRLEVLTSAVNEINTWTWDRIGKASVQKMEHGDFIGRAAFSIFIPPPLFGSEEGMKALRLIVAANMARLYQEATVTSLDLHQALLDAGIVPQGGPGSASQH